MKISCFASQAIFFCISLSIQNFFHFMRSTWLLTFTNRGGYIYIYIYFRSSYANVFWKKYFSYAVDKSIMEYLRINVYFINKGSYILSDSHNMRASRDAFSRLCLNFSNINAAFTMFFEQLSSRTVPDDWVLNMQKFHCKNLHCCWFQLPNSVAGKVETPSSRELTLLLISTP